MSCLRTHSFAKLAGRVFTGLVCAVGAMSAHALVVDIEALFKPDSSNPQSNKFINQTPSEGFCRQVPQACEPFGLFSLGAPISFTANAPILANHTDPRQGGMARVPSEWQDVLVTHESGDTKVLSVRIGGIGHEASIPRPITELTGGGWVGSTVGRRALDLCSATL